LLSSQDGKHPADVARLAFISFEYKLSTSALKNVLQYQQAYERMLEHCEGSHVAVPQSFDLVQHLLGWVSSAPAPVYLAVSTVYTSAVGGLEFDAVNAENLQERYAETFRAMLQAGITTARVVSSTNEDSFTQVNTKKRKSTGDEAGPSQPRRQSQTSGKQSTSKPQSTGQARGGMTGFKEFLVSKSIPLSDLFFDQQGCFYCGGSHKAVECRVRFDPSKSQDSNRKRARDLAKEYFAKK